MNEGLGTSVVPLSTLERFGFTRMESVVARALADGLTYKEIAKRFNVSYHTVHSHVKAIHEKAGVGNNGRLLALIYRRW
jgi:DNA-binding CsgD family transcriptional regulator